jgi:hypothetical protein
MVVSAIEVAVTVTLGVVGMVAGAVYWPEALMVPLVESPPPTPFTAHVTAVLDVLLTVAVNCCVVAGMTVAVAGVTLTVTAVFVLLAPPHPARKAETMHTTALAMRFMRLR